MTIDIMTRLLVDYLTNAVWPFLKDSIIFSKKNANLLSRGKITKILLKTNKLFAISARFIWTKL